MNISRQVELQIISRVVQSESWVLVERKHEKIKDRGVKEAIKEKFNTDVNRWKKEYAKYLYKGTKLRIEIHRCVNLNNYKEEFDIKIKRPRDKFWLEQIISIIEEELVFEEAAATKDD
jgi:hypothetical protein